MVDSGIGKSQHRSLASKITIICFVTLAIYNVIELNFIIFATFRKWRGLYFWSFLVSTWGIFCLALGFLLKDLDIPAPWGFYVTSILVGWSCMVTGQSFVLYSRLHLVLRKPFQLRLIRTMIIVNAIICHTPVWVMAYGANSSNSEPFLLPYSIFERIQVTIFFIQESIISILYIYHTTQVLGPEGNIRAQSSRRVLTHLIYVNIIIVILDITVLGLEYSGLYDIQTVYKALAYSVKLKLEFSILNRLVDLIQGKLDFSNNFNSDRTHRSMRLETFDEDRLKRTATSNDKEAGYKAYITSNGTSSTAATRVSHHENGGIVVTTTQVAVHSEGTLKQPEAIHSTGNWEDAERDTESLEIARSGTPDESQFRRSESSEAPFS